MGYSITYGTNTIFEPGSTVYVAHNVKITQASGGWSTLTFTIPGSHPLASQLAVHATDKPVKVYYNGVELFRGIVLSINTNFNLEKVVTCASELIYLNWAYTRYKPSNDRPGTALAELVGIYNHHVDLWGGLNGSQYYFSVDHDSMADYVGYENPDTGDNACDAEASTPMSVLEIINRSIIDPFGAYLRLRYDPQSDMRLLGIFPEPQDMNTQVIRLGENLLDYGYRSSDDDLYTAIYPVGGTADEAIEAPAEKYLRIGNAVPSGSSQLSLKSYNSGDTFTIYEGDIIIPYHIPHIVKATTVISNTPVNVPVYPPTSMAYAANRPVLDVVTNGEYYDKTITLLRKGNTHVGDYYIDGGMLYNLPAARKYGIKTMTFHDSDIKDVNQLMYRAIAALAPHISPTTSLSIKAIDTALYNGSYIHLQAGEMVRVVSAAHGIDMDMYVYDCSIDLDNPANTRYTLGTASPAITRAIADQKKQVIGVADNLITELNSTIADEVIGGLI